MGARLSSFVIWSLVAITAAFWALRIGARTTPVPGQATLVSEGDYAATAIDLRRLFGAPAPAPQARAPAPPPLSSRFKLVGVVAPPPGGSLGVALLAVDGQAARAYRVGSKVEGEWTLRSVSHRRVELASASGTAPLVLELPALAEAARGAPPAALPAAPSAGPSGAMVPGSRTALPRVPFPAAQPAAPAMPQPVPADEARQPPPGAVSQ